MTGEAPAAHAHRWLAHPVTSTLFWWTCNDEACGEPISLTWRPEWAGLGFEDLARIVEAEHGGTVIPGRVMDLGRAAAIEAGKAAHPSGPSRPHPRTLEQRVTAIEEQLTHPAVTLNLDPPQMSEEDITRLSEALGEAVKQPLRVLPPRPLLTPETARALLRECVTVVQPGEVLVIRVPDGWRADQAHRAQELISGWITEHAPGLKVLFVPDGEVTVAQPETDDQLTARIKQVLPGILARQVQTAR